MRSFKFVLFMTAFLTLASMPMVNAKPMVNLLASADESEQLIQKLTMANLEGQLYIQDSENNILDLGELRISEKLEKEIFVKKLMKMGFFLTNEGVVQSKDTFIAIVNTTTISNPDRTQYFYFTNVEGIEMGVFEIKNITTNEITLMAEYADGTKAEMFVRKKVGTFLPY